MRSPLVHTRGLFFLSRAVLQHGSISTWWKIACSIDAPSSTRFTDFTPALTARRPLLSLGAPRDVHSPPLGGGSVDFPDLSPLFTFPASYFPSSPTPAKCLIVQVGSVLLFNPSSMQDICFASCILTKLGCVRLDTHTHTHTRARTHTHTQTFLHIYCIESSFLLYDSTQV